jgi:serine/threonine protein phosphatase PrpC
MGKLNSAHTGQPIQGLQGTQSIAPENVEKVIGAATSLEEMINVITKFSFATKGGIAASNPYKQNQDAYLTNPHIMGLRHCHFFAVCDGHGTNGREVSNFMKQVLP